MSRKTFTGINIQFPISEEILKGKKTIETRTYNIPERYLNEEMLLVETPGDRGDFKARIRGIVKFTRCFKYKSKKDFYNDQKRHLVSRDSKWAWKDKPKYGWEVKIIKVLRKPISLHGKTKGIVYTKNLTL